MVHIDSVKKGFATFLDDELMPLVDTPLKKMGAGIALSLILNKFNNLADSLKSVWLIDMAGLFDEDMVDIFLEIKDKINELIDAVNELKRGN